MKLKFPSFPKLPSYKPKRGRTLRASTARAAQPSVDDYHDQEPTTSLSSAFIVVLVLHVVAVGGIYAFNSIKAHRKTDEIAVSAMEKASAKAAAAKEAAAEATPAPAALPVSAPVAKTQSAATAPAPTPHTYHVRAGETMAKIAGANGISAIQLADANNLKESAPLHAGQVLTIPPAKAGAVDQRKQDFLAMKSTTPRASARSYAVVKGDNPVAIARKLGVSFDQLMKLNGIDDPKKLQIGQVLKVPIKGGTSSSTQ
jgi:LysM repeat protein